MARTKATAKAQEQEPVAEVQQETAPTTTAIAEYSATEAALAELKNRLSGAKYEVTTTAGMETARKDRKELVTLRTDLEKKRLKLGEKARAHLNNLNTEAKRITAELLSLEQPIDQQIRAEEEHKAAIKEEKARIERERVAAITQRIDKIKALPLSAVDLPAGEMEIFIARVEAHQIGVEFAEMKEQAETAKTEAVATLKTMLADKQAQEAEAERLQAEAEERERVAILKDSIRAIQDWPRGCVGLSSANIITALKGFEAEKIGDFAEFQGEAEEAYNASIAEIRRMLDTAAEQEAAAARLKEEREELDKLRAEEAQRQQEREEAAEQERTRVAAIRGMIDGIKGWPLKCLNMNAQAIRQQIKTSEMDVACEVDDFAELTDEAERERVIALNTMNSMADAAEVREKEATKLAEEQAKLQREKDEAARIEQEKVEAAAAEERRIAAEKADAEYKASMDAATADPVTTLNSILDACRDTTLSAQGARILIEELARRGVEKSQMEVAA